MSLFRDLPELLKFLIVIGLLAVVIITVAGINRDEDHRGKK